ncbi:DUF2752 domain-containing protein [Gabonibacter chumensis]|uniref:DUF2752 domain-containing protein n=1 Tax=Gabonibacter chumensis TaxID=2972474 RepID=UPI003369E5E7
MTEWFEVHQLSCWIKALCGMDCPGCGFQTAMLLLMKGEVSESIVTYPALLPFMWFILLIIGRIVGIKKIETSLLKISGFACLIIILISYLFKLMSI